MISSPPWNILAIFKWCILLMDNYRVVRSWLCRHFLGLIWSRLAPCASLRRAPKRTSLMNWYRLRDLSSDDTLWLNDSRLWLIIEHLLRRFALRWVLFLWCYLRAFLLCYDSLCFTFLSAYRFALARGLRVSGCISSIWLLDLSYVCRLLGSLLWGGLLFGIGFNGGLSRSGRVVGISTTIWVFVRPTCLLLIALPGVHSESKALTASLIIGSWLWYLLLEIEVWVIILVLNTGWCWRARLYDNWIYVLNLGDFDLLLSILSWRAAASHRLRRGRAVPAAATAHQSRIVSKLEALVGFARADWGIVMRPNLTACEALL